MKELHTSQHRIQHIKRLTPQICENQHKYIPVKGQYLLCLRETVPPTVQSVSEEESGGGEEKEYDFTSPRMFKL